MSGTAKVGIIGAGWPGSKHAEGYHGAGGFQIVAVADLIPERRAKLKSTHGIKTEYNSAEELIKDKAIEVVSVCLPNHLHASVALQALRAGKHAIIESPPTMNAKEARQIEAAAVKNGKMVLYAHQRRFGGPELAAKQTIEKGYAGDVYHARAVWTRTRGVPKGTGWYTKKAESGGGAMIDLGSHLLDLAWHLMGQPRPESVFAVAHSRFKDRLPDDVQMDVEDSAFAMIRFEGGKSIEVATSWVANQPPTQNGTVCRLYGDQGAVEVYTPTGAVAYRNFDKEGKSKPIPLKPPQVGGHVAMMRHFRQCLLGKATPSMGAAQGVTLMQMIDGIYKSAETGKSVSL
jgi:predicted dehydrogenase